MTKRTSTKKTSVKKITSGDIDHLAKLSHLPLTLQEREELTTQVEVTLEYVSKLQEVDTKNIIETSQVTGLENVLREDEVDTSRMFTQDEALANAKHTHNGYFVVDAILEE